MLYKYDVCVAGGLPHPWPKLAPLELKANLASGVVSQVMIEFPAGCAGLVGCRISRGLFQLWPLTAHEWFISDDFTVDFKEELVLDEGPCILRIEAYNEDDTYDHTLKVSFSIVEDKPDPIQQMAEIMARSETEAAPVSFLQVATIAERMHQMYALLYAIHAQDFPALLAYLDQMRG